MRRTARRPATRRRSTRTPTPRGRAPPTRSVRRSGHRGATSVVARRASRRPAADAAVGASTWPLTVRVSIHRRDLRHPRGVMCSLAAPGDMDGPWHSRKKAPMASEELLASWNDTPTRAAIVDFVERVTSEDPTTSRPRSGSPRSTTTARCGARSRCRSSSPSSSSGWPRWRRRSVAADEAAVEGGLRARLRMAERRWSPSTTPGDDADVKVLMAGVLQAFAGHDRRRVRRGRPTSSFERPPTRRSTARYAPAPTSR